MSCPLLTRSSCRCRAVADAPHALPRLVLATYCHAAHESCPAFRYLRAAGHPAHPADFRAWVILGVSPGKTETSTDVQSGVDA